MKSILRSSSPIPLDAGQVTGWKDIPIQQSSRPEPLVPLGPLSQEGGQILTSSIYFGEHSNSPYGEDKNKLEGSLLTLFARQSVVHRLLLAEQFLPAGYHLIVFDAYRSYQVQKSLYDFYAQKLSEKYPSMNNEALAQETQKYVSLPSTDSAKPSPHNTGGAIDVAIVTLDKAHENELLRIRSELTHEQLDLAKRVGLEMQLSALVRHHASMLNFGTAFDHGGEKSSLGYYESKIAAGETLTHSDTQACNNRRLLFTVMTHAGFQPYFAEWWHFNAPESQMGAAAAGLDNAIFGAATLSKTNQAHEATRLAIRKEALALQKEGKDASVQTTLQAEILAVIRSTGDLRIGGEWPTEIIAPSKE